MELQPGSATNLPITVRNDGGTVSEPVVVALKLPPGVAAVPAGGGSAARSLVGESAVPPAQNSVSVNCPGGTGTVTCRTGQGLQPGQSAVLLFRLLADETAQPATVTGSITAGSQIKVSVSVKVTVKAPPDAVVLRVGSTWDSAFPWVKHPLVRVDVRNTGPTVKPVTLTLDQQARLVIGNWRATCRPTIDGTNCSTKGTLKPGERLHLWLVLQHRPQLDEGVTVTATLGVATVSKTLYFDCWGPVCECPEGMQPSSGSGEPPARPATPDKPPIATTPPTSTGRSGDTRQPNVTTSEPPLPPSP